MSNSSNSRTRHLIPCNARNKSETSAMGVVGGSKSGEVRRKMKVIKDIYEKMLSLPPSNNDNAILTDLATRGVDISLLTEADIMAIENIKTARYNPAMQKQVLQVIEQAPVEKTQIDINGGIIVNSDMDASSALSRLLGGAKAEDDEELP